jgi:hypothetical protein
MIEFPAESPYDSVLPEQNDRVHLRAFVGDLNGAQSAGNPYASHPLRTETARGRDPRDL